MTRIWKVDQEVVENLLNLDTMFWVLFTGKDTASDRSLHVLRYFLDNHTLSVPVVEVPVTGIEEAAYFNVAFLPQLRLYHRGVEIKRHRGTVNIDVLAQFQRRSLI